MTDIQVQQPTELDGFYEGMSFEDYVKAPGLNASSLIPMRRSPMQYRYQRDNPRTASAAMIIGVLAHRVILEPHLINKFAVWGREPWQKVRNGKAWSEWANEQEADGCTILTVAEFDAISGIAAAARMNAPLCIYADAPGETEVSMFWKHPHTGRQFKGRLDKAVLMDTPILFDLKTCRDCHSYAFGKQAYALGYHIKMAHYWDGYRQLTGIEPQVVLGAVESKAPHESAVYRMTRDVILQGLEERDQLINRVTECEAAGNYPAEYNEESDLLLPSWAVGADFDEI